MKCKEQLDESKENTGNHGDHGHHANHPGLAEAPIKGGGPAKALFDHLPSRLLAGIFLGVAVYLLFLLLGDQEQLLASVRQLNAGWLILTLCLTLIGYALRYVRWAYYLQRLELRVPWRENTRIYLASLAMAITPGKVGELLKSYLLYLRLGIPFAHSAPAVFAERFTDLTAILLLMAVGVSFSPYGFLPLLIAGTGFMFFTFCLQSVRLMEMLIQRICRLRWFSCWEGGLLRLYRRTRRLLHWQALLAANGLGMLAWGMECLGLYVLLKGLGADLGLLPSAFAFSSSMFVGALSMLPGGLGAADGSMAGTLYLLGVSWSHALAATLLVRAATLWFGVILGLAVFAGTRKFRRR